MESINTNTATATEKGKATIGKSGKKICCSCPETRQQRDECVVLNGPSACEQVIEAHKRCLREEGFKVE